MYTIIVVALGVGFGLILYATQRESEYHKFLDKQVHKPDGRWVDYSASLVAFYNAPLWSWDFESMVVSHPNKRIEE